MIAKMYSVTAHGRARYEAIVGIQWESGPRED